ncbi:hypothetical protein AMJ50_02905 [Parcubacteria bacterium DG_74_3]|nr:MAG: hypothetical protein AMJ50_02905 [Parcubacteria bacterium DG_74_3]
MLIFSFSLGQPVRATGASFSIFPQGGTFTTGSTFEISVFVNTGGSNVNAIQVDLKFDPDKLQVITPTKGISVIGKWIFPPSFSNTKGIINLQGGFLQEGINTSEGLVTVIVFEAISPGRTEIRFLDSSQVLVGEKEGINILTSVNRGIYDIIPAPSKGPRIFSETHPDQNSWYKNNNPTFSWERIEGAEGFSYKLDDDPLGEPDNTIDTPTNFISFEEVEDGILYFHLKAKKEKIWGGTSHYKVMIDSSPPLKFQPYLEPLTLTPGNYLLVYFETTDLLSGIDHYKARLADLSDPQDVVFSAWARQESPFRLSKDRKGIFEFQVRAFDEAGNFQEGKIQIKIVNPLLILASGGIQIKGMFFPWWQVYFLAGMILLLTAFFIFSLIKRKRESLRIRLYKEIKEAEKEIEDVKEAEEKLRRLRIMEEQAGKEWRRLKERLEEETE